MPKCSASPAQPCARCSSANRTVRGGRPRRVSRAVHHVVVDQRGGLEELQRRRRVRRSARRPARPRRASPSSRTPAAAACRRAISAVDGVGRAGRSRRSMPRQHQPRWSSRAWSSSAPAPGSRRSRRPAGTRGPCDPVRLGSGRRSRAGSCGPDRSRARRLSSAMAYASRGAAGWRSWASGHPAPAASVAAYAGRMPWTLTDALVTGPSYSFEFFPPQGRRRGEAQLWQAIRRLEPLAPTFVSVTYGAGGSTRDRTVRITRRIAEETTLTPVAHLTCVAATRGELRRVVGAYAGGGVRNVLALRGDPPGGPGGTLACRTRSGLDHADELVRLVRELGRVLRRRGGVPGRCTPSRPTWSTTRGSWPPRPTPARSSPSPSSSSTPDDYFRLRRAGGGARLRRSRSCPGIMPVTNVAADRAVRQAVRHAGCPTGLAAGCARSADDPADGAPGRGGARDRAVPRGCWTRARRACTSTR